MLCGFGIPIYVFGQYAWRRLDQFASPGLADAFLNSLMTAGFTAVLTVVLALFLLNAVRMTRSQDVTVTVRLASVGYALPGGILGLGLLFALARFDNTLDAFTRAHLGYSTGLLLTGSAAAVILACSIRFLALAEGAIRAGMEKLPGNLDEAARSLGRTPAQSGSIVLLPLLSPAIFTAAVLVFVDTIKELSATILLRPFGFSTLATFVYENASRGVLQDGAAAAIVIIVTAPVPVLLLSRPGARQGRLGFSSEFAKERGAPTGTPEMRYAVTTGLERTLLPGGGRSGISPSSCNGLSRRDLNKTLPSGPRCLRLCTTREIAVNFRDHDLLTMTGSGLCSQLRQVPEQLQRLRIGERLAVLDRPAMDDVAHGELGDLAGLGARNVGDRHDPGRHVARAGARADLARGCAVSRSVVERARPRQPHEQHDAHVAVAVLADAERLGDLRHLLDLVVDLRRADPHAARVERGIRAAMDDRPPCSVHSAKSPWHQMLSKRSK